MACAPDVQNIIKLRQESGRFKVLISIFYIKDIGGCI